MASVWAVPNGPSDAAAPAAPAVAAAPADSAAPADIANCGLLWQIKVQLGAGPRSLLVDMAFDAGPRTRTSLRLPGGWAGVVETSAGLSATSAAASESTSTATSAAVSATAGTAARAAPLARLQAVADMPTLRTVNHAAGERVQLRWRLTPLADPAQGGSVQLADTWFALAGQGVLPVPDDLDERRPPTACIAFTA